MADEPIKIPEMCVNCKYYSADNQCRRYPPVVVVWDDVPATVWPDIYSTNWCGEFKDVDDDKVKVEVKSSPK